MRRKYLTFKMFKPRLSLQSIRVVFPIRNFNNEQKDLTQMSSIQQRDEKYEPIVKEMKFGGVTVKYWNEKSAVRMHMKQNTFPYSLHTPIDLLRFLQSIKSLPKSVTEFVFFLKRKVEKKNLIEQAFLPERQAVLRPDLAAAHFLINRGGSVKFVGKDQWVGRKGSVKALPMTYVPGYFVEAIKAENTYLMYEGLPNIGKLKYLRNLSLKNLIGVNEWFLDWVSKEYHSTLTHLDISGCVNVTYRSLSCFYRFENLETLDVEGVPDTPEFKLACLMLLEQMPHLEIKGIDLSIPKKINVDELKEISEPDKQIQSN